MMLPLVNVFSNVYIKKSYRDRTDDECLEFLKNNENISTTVADKVKECIWFAKEAADYICRVGIDDELDTFIEQELKKNINYAKMIWSMPPKTPSVLLNYKTSSNNVDLLEVDREIDIHGKYLSNGQYLFHGGNWDSFIDVLENTSRPLSTSFCPQIALRNAEWGGKAYHAGKVDLLVLKVTNPKTKAFVYNNKISKAIEKEVLFSSGAKLLLKKKETMKYHHYVGASDGSWGTLEKIVPYSLIEVDIS
ncbi:hypothetical protein [Aeromonas hydrophila]|uniref:hypothetical protein n=1 Tax=Aeromonas hydrophila TaxID=644 RepID=UPI002B488271|nr:hypothetical protein [Aeromonas hydrophila]